MSRLKSIRERWLPVLAAFVIGGMLTGVAGAHTGFPDFLHAGHSDTMLGTLTAQNFKFSAPKANKIVVPGAAFIPDNRDTVFTHQGYSGAIELDPVSRPWRRSTSRMERRSPRWRWYDTSGATAANAIELHLEANDLTGGHDDMSLIDSLACATNPCVTNDTTIAPDIVNNNAIHYGLWMDNEGGGNITVYKVVISYTTTNVGPATGQPPGDWRLSQSHSH